MSPAAVRPTEPAPSRLAIPSLPGELPLDFDAQWDGAAASSPDDEWALVRDDELLVDVSPRSHQRSHVGARDEAGNRARRVEDALERVDFLLEQGLAATARAELLELLAIAPSHALALEKLAELEAALALAPLDDDDLDTAPGR